MRSLPCWRFSAGKNEYGADMPSVLIVDDEPRILTLLSSLLKTNAIDSVPARDGTQALKALADQTFDCIVSDIRMTPMDGMELFRNVRTSNPEIPFVLLTAYGTVETAIEAMRLGAFDYLTKPFKIDDFLTVIRRAIAYKSVVGNQPPVPTTAANTRFEHVIAESEAMKKACEVVKRVAPTDATVLIEGESGTGKEVIARALHENSLRKDKPFIAVNCAAVPENLMESEMFGHIRGSFTGATTDKMGLFEAATGGTLFLDEITSLPLALQGKLLRVLQEQEVRRVGATTSMKVDVRVLAASNARLEDKVKTNAFRQDLYYRIAVITIDLPPLRERVSDILPLAGHFLSCEATRGRGEHRLSREAADILIRHLWPGNVRELENAIRHAVTFADSEEITPDLLPPRIVSSAANNPTPVIASAAGDAANECYRNQSLRAFLREKEKDYLEQVLSKANGNKEKAAKALQISLATLYRKLPESEASPLPTEQE
jgi:DNA-binding NtrC family response regulator